jgi:hypothetical protein
MHNDRDDDYDYYGENRYGNRFSDRDDESRGYRSTGRGRGFGSEHGSPFSSRRHDDERNFFERAGDRIRETWNDITDRDDDDRNYNPRRRNGRSGYGMSNEGTNWNVGNYGNRYDNDRGSSFGRERGSNYNQGRGSDYNDSPNRRRNSQENDAW